MCRGWLDAIAITMATVYLSNKIILNSVFLKCFKSYLLPYFCVILERIACIFNLWQQKKTIKKKKLIFLFAEVLDWKTAGVFEHRSHLQVARLSSWKQFNLVEKLFKIRKMFKWSQFKVKVFFKLLSMKT